MIALAPDLFFDLDGLDGLISDTETVLSVYGEACGILLAFVVIGACVERFRRRSPVEKLSRRRFG